VYAASAINVMRHDQRCITAVMIHTQSLVDRRQLVESICIVLSERLSIMAWHRLVDSEATAEGSRLKICREISD
jgi:hypothetical protein